MRRPLRRFLFGLARDLGMTVAELGTRLTSAELVEWLALHRLEARAGAERSLRDDLMAGARTAARDRREQARPRPRGVPAQAHGAKE